MLAFEKARSYVHKVGLQSSVDWRNYCKSGKKPNDIPANPARSYGKKWKGMGDWLGTGRTANQNKEYRSFLESKEFVRGLKLKTSKEWEAYCKAGKKPDDIPNTPWHLYRAQWKSMGDWLGTETLYLPFQKAKNFAHALGLKSYSEWKNYCNSGKKPDTIPLSVATVYRKEWRGWGDFLGTGRKAQFKGEYRPFEAARSFVRSLGLKNQKEWAEYSKSVDKPIDIPAGPARVYKEKGWKGYGDWLGTGRIANQNLEFLTFSDARKFVHSLGLKNRKEWRHYLMSGNKPPKLPSNPLGV